MITIENLRKEFDHGVVALDDINLTVEEGTFVALLGPSGCGKTTTLNCLAGLLEPTSGAIFFDGQNVTELAPKDRNIGMVFQSYALYPHLKVIDNIAFPLKQKGVGKEERHDQARAMAEKLQIGHLLDRRPAELSGGQQQRVAMARALVKQPKILLLDEPMSNLDARLKIEIREEIRRIQQEVGVTSVIVTHDQEEAMAIADKIAILDNGRIQQFDTPDVLYHAPANLFVAHFMGNPPMNFIDAALAADEDDPGVPYLSGEDFHFPAPERLRDKLRQHLGKRVVIGARSHQMKLVRLPSTRSITVRLQIAENLGKELLLSGRVGENVLRVTAEPAPGMTHEDFKAIQRSAENLIYVELDAHINVFDKENGVNLGL